jgi:hypothetical protein
MPNSPNNASRRRKQPAEHLAERKIHRYQHTPAGGQKNKRQKLVKQHRQDQALVVRYEGGGVKPGNYPVMPTVIRTQYPSPTTGEKEQ